MRRIPTLSSPLDDYISLPRSDYKKILRVVKEVERYISPTSTGDTKELCLAIDDLNKPVRWKE